MSGKATYSKPPYHRIGESYQFLSSALDTKSTNHSMRRKLERLAREGDFDWELRSKIANNLIAVPLRRLDPDFSAFTNDFIEDSLDRYISVVLTISLDALTRGKALPTLILCLYAPAIADYLLRLYDRFGGPDLIDALHENNRCPVDVVFIWAEEMLGFDIAKAVFPENKLKRDDILRWRRGAALPGFYSSILPLIHDLKKQHQHQAKEITLFGVWLVVARSIQWIYRAAHHAGYGWLPELVSKEVEAKCPTRDIGAILSYLNVDEGADFPDLARTGGKLLNFVVTRTRRKDIGDESLARAEIDQFRVLSNEQDVDGITRYGLDWCEGRWHILAGQELEALTYYESAADQALYRSGANQKEILKESITLAA